MKMFNFRTKFEVAGAVFMVAILLTACVLGGTRIISDSNDNTKTFITNSNGNYWDATGVNLQAAIWDLNNSGGDVNIPDNTILIDAELKIGSNIYMQNGVYKSITIRGCGANTELKATSNMFAIFNLSESNWVMFENIVFNGNNKADHCMYVDIDASALCGWINIEKCVFHNSIISNVYMNASGCRISESSFGNAKFGINITTGSGHIRDCSFCGNSVCGIYSNKSNNIIMGCTFESLPLGINMEYETGTLIKRNRIIGNTFVSPTGTSTAIKLEGVYSSIISGNTIYMYDYGIKLLTKSDVHCLRNIITGNTLYSDGTEITGIEITSGAGNSIASNTIRNYDTGIIIDYTGGNGENVVMGNTIRSATNGIVETAGSDYDIITKNTFRDVTTGVTFVGSNTIVNDNIGYDYNSLFPFYEQATPPTVVDNCSVYWHNTSSGCDYLCINTYGTQKYLNFTTII